MEPKVAQQHCVTKTRQGRNLVLRIFDGVLRLFLLQFVSQKCRLRPNYFCRNVLTSTVVCKMVHWISLIPVDSFREHGFTEFASPHPVCQKVLHLVRPLPSGTETPWRKKMRFGSFCPFRSFCAKTGSFSPKRFKKWISGGPGTLIHYYHTSTYCTIRYMLCIYIYRITNE